MAEKFEKKILKSVIKERVIALGQYLSSKDLLEVLVMAGAFTLISISPALLAPAILFANPKLVKIPRGIFDKRFYYLKKKGFVKGSWQNNTVTLIPTKKGCSHIFRHVFKPLVKPKNWDGKWRLLIFDIKTECKNKRDALRFALKRLSFVQMQKSVWLHAYDCSEEMAFLRKNFVLTDEELRLIVSDDIGDDSKFRKVFSLK